MTRTGATWYSSQHPLDMPEVASAARATGHCIASVPRCARRQAQFLNEHFHRWGVTAGERVAQRAVRATGENPRSPALANAPPELREQAVQVVQEVIFGVVRYTLEALDEGGGEPHGDGTFH